MLRVNQGFNVVFYHRDGNKVADKIVKETLSFLTYVPKLYYATLL